MKHLGPVGLVTGLALLFAACGGDTHTVSGDLYYSGEPASLGGGDRCIGQSGTPFVGLQSGTEVDMTDGSGNTIGLGALAEAPDSGSTTIPGFATAATCHFTFSIANVKKADFYKVAIGGRQGPTYSYDQLAGMGWKIAIKSRPSRAI